MLLISFQDMQNQLSLVLLKYGFSKDKAGICARVFAGNSLDGVYSHGVNRFPRFIDQVKSKQIKVHAEPVQISGQGAFEQWDGNLGPGILNAMTCTDRAMTLAREYGVGCVGLGHTNHWMRGGTYGRVAAEAGYAFIGWTNTRPNMPAWGAVDCRLGNNPLVLAVPGREAPVVMDMAMSQFSYGKMEVLAEANRHLPVAGGYNRAGQITTDPKEILETMRPLPAGYWKGAGLSLLLDMLAATLSGGLAAFQVGKLPDEYNLSQVFIVFNTLKAGIAESSVKLVQEIIGDYKDSNPQSEKSEIFYPGERVLLTRQENLAKGIPVPAALWEKIENL